MNNDGNYPFAMFDCFLIAAVGFHNPASTRSSHPAELFIDYIIISRVCLSSCYLKWKLDESLISLKYQVTDGEIRKDISSPNSSVVCRDKALSEKAV